MNPNAPPALLLFTSYIICMFRIRKDIHRDVVRWDSWRTKNKKGGRRKRGVTTKVCRNLVTFDLVVFSFISGKITVTGKKNSHHKILASKKQKKRVVAAAEAGDVTKKRKKKISKREKAER